MADQVRGRDFSHIVNYAAECDIYPALALFDALVTDYSSIYFDYLLLDRPVFFFPYDLEHYVAGERKLLFGYREMAPGPLCRTREELQAEILTPDNDYWRKRRREVRASVFDHLDDKAGLRLYQFLQEQSLARHESTIAQCGSNP